VTTWAAVANNTAGTTYIPHAVLTFSGTWAPPGVGYPTDVVNGLSQFVNPNLCEEIPVIAPWSFGVLGGDATADSYDQSVNTAIEWAGNWITDNPTRTFALGGYSQGAEAASKVAIELQSGALTAYAENWIGGYTHGNPCRMLDSVAPGVVNPGNYRGISSVNMTSLPKINGQVVWADYVHSKANGDAGLDMYGCVSDDEAGTLMTEWYTTATVGDLNSFMDFTMFIVDALKAIVDDVTNIVTGGLSAAEQGIAFLTAPGGATAPHVTYEAEQPGYSNLVADAVGFLNQIATLTPARA
jgi:hypothetical protein